MTITADNLMSELQARGYRADVLYSRDDPDNLSVDVVRVWAERYDRYPAQCVNAPLNSTDRWEWGHRFEYCAGADASAPALADAVIATLTDVRG